ncbi:MAG: hypothetical protein ACTHLY_19860 [Pseudolabrys sp.]
MPRPEQPADIVQALFVDDGAIPNNPRWPFVVYRRAFDLARDKDPEDRIERTFKANGWGDSWRYGIYFYTHYHSAIHEVLGVARGTARVQFGGDQGRAFDLAPGDVAILPAGTGHRCLESSADFCVVGAYPPQGRYTLFRGSAAEYAAALETIPQVPRPDTDPVFGADGPLMTLWRAEPA